MYKVMSATTVALVDPQYVSQVMSFIDRNTQDISESIFKTNTYIGSGIAQPV
jgi:hypothetical protein